MHNLIFSACTLLSILTSNKLFAQDDAEKKDMKKLQGAYSLASGEFKGKALSAESIKGASIIIDKNSYNVKIGETTVIGTQKLSPGKLPKEIDAMGTEGPNQGLTLGIYKLENGEFTVCFAAPGKDRPKEFTTKSGTGELLHIWADNLQGAYSLASGELKGNALSAEYIKGASIIIDKNNYNVKIGETTIIGTQKLSPGKSPKEIDAMGTEGPNKGLTLGIYKFEKGVFTVCFAAPGKDRPKEFTSKSGTGEFMHIWKKK